MIEIWKDIPGYEGLYQVSDMGRVKAMRRQIIHSNGNTHTYQERILRTLLDRSGYHAVILCNTGDRKRILVHRLVAESFKDKKVNQDFVNHIDCIKSNNYASNLEWVSHAENVRHAFANNRYDRKGSKHPSAKINESIVKQIRESKARTVDLASQLGLTEAHVYSVRSFKSWAHV